LSTAPALRECPGCGLFQVVPELDPGMAAHCPRCATALRRVRADPLRRGLALYLTSLILLVILAAAPMMTVERAGIRISADLFSGPEELVRRGMAPLALVVLGVTLLIPLARLLALLHVLAWVRRPDPPRSVARAFVLAERLGPWAMIDVFVFGVFVAYSKLGGLVTITLDVGTYALCALTVALVWADGALDRHAVWDAIAPDPPPAPQAHGLIGCETCALVSRVPPGAEAAACPRCDSPLHRRKPDSIARTWALVIAAAVLYVPANYYPVLTVVQLGAGAPSTILGGVRELVEAKEYPLAALVFFASVAVPMLKLVGLAIMLVATQRGRAGWLRDRTRLYHVVRWIGRWSMIDIFMESLLGALVRFGTIVTIAPGAGALAFCAVVILTMFAAETFDPRLMWDAAARRRAALPPGAALRYAAGDEPASGRT
jgi:paraquat-inducible protein A